MRRWKLSILALVALAALAQTSSQRQSVDVGRVGARLACKCGVCSASLATCPMLECGFGKPAKERIFKLQRAGVPDSEIIRQFVGEYGKGIYLEVPSPLGWMIPYLSIIPGVLLIWWFVRRYYRRRPVIAAGPNVEDPELSRYQDQIEKELTRLE